MKTEWMTSDAICREQCAICNSPAEWKAQNTDGSFFCDYCKSEQESFEIEESHESEGNKNENFSGAAEIEAGK